MTSHTFLKTNDWVFDETCRLGNLGPHIRRVFVSFCWVASFGKLLFGRLCWPLFCDCCLRTVRGSKRRQVCKRGACLLFGALGLEVALVFPLAYFSLAWLGLA